jgi:hypothetical protein
MWYIYVGRQDSWYQVQPGRGEGEFTLTLPANRYGPFENSAAAERYATGRQFKVWVSSKEND